MKVLIVSYPNSIHTQRWVSALCNQGINVALFGSRPSDSAISFYKSLPNCTCFWEEAERLSFLSKVAYLRQVKILKKVIKLWKPDIVHAHWATRYGLISSLTGFHPFITSVWGSDIYVLPKNSIIYRNIVRFVFKRSDYIFSTSHSMAIEAHKYTSKNISITPFGVNTSLFKSNKKPGNSPFIIGNIKTLDPIYGIDILIKAFKLVVESNPNRIIKLVIIGDGPYKTEYLKLVKDLDLSSLVTFNGRINNDLLPSYYDSFSVAVFPSRSESFGVVAVEAMSCECPVIASDAEGYKEVVEDGVTGYIVERENVEMTASAIQRFIDNPQLRDRMGKEGRKRVLAHYSWDDNVRTMISLYKKIIFEFYN